MLKLTKAQWKDKDRIDSWLSGTPFKENSKTKPSVPVMSAELVRDTYVPSYIQEFGSYYTPPSMALELYSHLECDLDTKVLDPCAGIGNLLVPFMNNFVHPHLTAFEADDTAYRIGRKLFPTVDWHLTNAFSMPRVAEYDIVMMNPPFGITWAVQEGLDKSILCKKSEHLFLELAFHFVKPGGIIALIAPHNAILNMPVAFSVWFKEHINSIIDLGELPGEFRFTKIRVHGFLIERNTDPLPSDVVPVATVAPFVKEYMDNRKDAIAGSPEAFKQYRDFITKYGHVLSPSQKQTLREARFLHVVPDFVAWLEKASLNDYSHLFFHGMKPVP